MNEPIRILIVEDLPADAELARREISQVLESCIFQQVDTRRDYLAALETFQPHLIISDYRMPRFDGLTVLKLAQERAPLTPVIILTGAINEDTAVECMKAGAADYVIKEYIKRLGQAVLHALEEKQLRQERRRAEEALRESEERYRTLAEAANDIIFIVDIDDRYQYINEFGAYLLERQPQDIIGQKRSDFFPPDAAEQQTRIIQRVLETGEPGHYEGPMPTRDRDAWFSTSVIPLRDKTGNINAVMGISRDITKRKQIEAQLERGLRETRLRYEISQAMVGVETEEQGLDMLIQHAGLYPLAHMSILTLDRTGSELAVILRRDEPFESGIACLMPIGARFPASLHPALNLCSASQMFVSENALTDELIDPASREIIRQSGATSLAMAPLTLGNEWMGLITILARPAGYFDEEKRHLYQMLAEQGAAALRAARLREAIRASQQRLAQFVQQSPLAVIEWDMDLQVVMWNPAAEQIFGYTRQEAMGRQPTGFTVSEEAWPLLDQIRQNILARQGGTLTTYDHLTKDGRTITCEWFYAPLVGADGQVTGIATLTQDITERKQAEQELAKYRDHLEELVRERTAELTMAKEHAVEAQRAAEAANRAKSAFLANMSHELRTPLNAILGYAQILQRRKLDADVLNSLGVVQKSGEHLLTLINDLLDLSKIEAGRMELYPVSIHFPNFLEHIVSIIHARAEARRLTFSFEALSSLPLQVRADETRLRQVLLNLLGNAVKFTDAGQVTLRVEQISDRQPKGAASQRESAETVRSCADSLTRLRFQVQDTGTGISPDQLERIFQPFEQAENTVRRTEGTGLGLTISRQLVRLMGGELRVQSQPGQGSTFWFEVALPVTPVVAEAPPPPERLITGYTGPRRTVLVADDVPSNRAVLTDLLRPLGFDVVEAANGLQAVHLARELHPDLILMDRWMPVLDGLEAARRLRQIPELGRVPLIAISASVSEQDQEQSRQVGLDAFLPKPVHWPQLAALLQELLALEWIYAAEEKEKKTLAPLVPPPQDELVILRELAMRGNMRAILQRAAHIETLGEPYAPFVARLRQMANAFEVRQILDWIKHYME